MTHEGIARERLAVVYIRWSDDGQHIRKWSFEPFEGSQAFTRAQTAAGEEMVERVAKALRAEEWGDVMSWDEADDSDREYWRKSARAAIAAMEQRQ